MNLRATDAFPGGARSTEIRRLTGALSNPEIAQTLHVTSPAIKSRVHRARLFLRRRLAGYVVGAPQYCMQIHINPCHAHATRESDGLRRTSQETEEARGRAGRAAQRDD